MSSKETREVHVLTDDNEVAKQAQSIIDKVKALDPNNILCAMGIFVVKKDENGVQPEGLPVDIQAFTLGNSGDIAKMLQSLLVITQRGIDEANDSIDHSKEAKH